MPLPTSPVIRRQRLGVELRRLRRQQSLTLEQVCARVGWASTSKLSRIELGQSRPDLADVLDLLDLYAVPAAQREALIVVARDAAVSRGWWKSFGEMGDRQRVYAELEAGASAIFEYQPLAVPGLLQTVEYARLRLRAGHRLFPSLDVETDTRARIARQQVLRRSSPPWYAAVLDEGLFYRGGTPPEVLRGQLRHLIALTELPNVTVRVLPVGANLPAGLEALTPFSRYAFPDPADPQAVVLEALTTDVRLVSEAEVSRYAQVIGWLTEAALGPADSVQALGRLAQR